MLSFLILVDGEIVHYNAFYSQRCLAFTVDSINCLKKLGKPMEGSHTQMYMSVFLRVPLDIQIYP